MYQIGCGGESIGSYGNGILLPGEDASGFYNDLPWTESSTRCEQDASGMPYLGNSAMTVRSIAPFNVGFEREY
jgi:hypothetical protein